MNKFVVYDAVENDISYFESKEEADKELKRTVGLSVEDGEWMDYVEHSFVAEIVTRINPLRVQNPSEAERQEGFNYITEMTIVAVESEKDKHLEILATHLKEWARAIDEDPEWDGWEDYYKDVRYNETQVKYLVEKYGKKYMEE